MKKINFFRDTCGQLGPTPHIPGAGLPVPPGAAPAVSKLSTNVKWIIVAIAFIAVVVLEVIGGQGLLIATIILGVFGFIHLFARGSIAKFILGVIPLVLAIVALPEVFGGSGFGDIVGKIPLIGWISPNNWPGWAIRYAILAGVLLYYHHFLKNVLLQYARMGGAAGTVAAKGAGYAWQHFSFGRILVWVLIVAAIYGLDNYGQTLGIGLPAEYGTLFVSLGLFILGFIFIFRQSFAFRLMGLIAIVLGIAGFSPLIPYVSEWFKNDIMQNFAPGQTNYIRYGFIAVIIFYFLFRGKAWAQQQVT